MFGLLLHCSYWRQTFKHTCFDRAVYLQSANALSFHQIIVFSLCHDYQSTVSLFRDLACCADSGNLCKNTTKTITPSQYIELDRKVMRLTYQMRTSMSTLITNASPCCTVRLARTGNCSSVDGN